MPRLLSGHSRDLMPLHPLTTLLMTATLIVGLALGMLAGSQRVNAASSLQASPSEMIASLDGLESAYARRYVSADQRTGSPTQPQPPRTPP